LPIHEQTTCNGNDAASSVSRLARRLWNSFGHATTPARRMMRSNCVRRLTLLSWYLTALRRRDDSTFWGSVSVWLPLAKGQVVETKKACESDRARAGMTIMALHGQGQNGQGGHSQQAVFLEAVRLVQLGGHSAEQPRGQAGSAQQSVTLAAGKTGCVAVGVVFAMPTPRTDISTVRTDNALNLLMAALLGHKTGT
jgi:hypothetical protein